MASENKALTNVMTFLLIPFVYLYASFADGYVAHKLWVWFAFPSWPGMRWEQFAAAGMMIGLARYSLRVPRKEWRESADQNLHMAAHFAFPWTVLLIGWWLR